MGLLTSILAVAAGTAIAAGSVAASNKSSSEAKKAASAANDRQRQLEDSARSRMANEESDANKIAVRDAARRKQKQLASAASGVGDTILTNAQGDVGAVQQTGLKTLTGE